MQKDTYGIMQTKATSQALADVARSVNEGAHQVGSQRGPRRLQFSTGANMASTLPSQAFAQRDGGKQEHSQRETLSDLTVSVGPGQEAGENCQPEEGARVIACSLA